MHRFEYDTHNHLYRRVEGGHLPVTALDRAAIAAHPDAGPIRLDSRRVASVIWWSAVALLIVLALPGLWASRHELGRRPSAEQIERLRAECERLPSGQCRTVRT